MPLAKGSAEETISKNITEMVEHGHPQKQAVAAALHTALDDEPPNLKVKSMLIPPTNHKNDHQVNAGAYGKGTGMGIDAAYSSVGVSVADISKMGEEFWNGMNGNVGSPEGNASSLPQQDTAPTPIRVYAGMADAQFFDELEPTQSDPPDRRSDNLLSREHGGIPGTEA
jgi:hypothetical protein